MIAITGAGGFVGQHLIKRCLDEGLKVRVLTRENNPYYESLGIEVFVGDLRTTSDWSSFLCGVDIIINAAAEIKNPNLMQAVNINGPKKLLEAAINVGVKHWIQLSSVGAYGRNVNTNMVNVVNDEDICTPVNEYEITKTSFDLALISAAKASSITYTILRPSNVVGSNMPNQSFKRLVREISKGRFFYIGSREAISTYVHVDDVVEALILCALHPKAKNQVFNLSNDCKLSDIVEIITRSNGGHNKVMCFPDRPLRFIVKILSNFISLPLTENRINSLTSKVSYPTDKIKKYLGFTPKKSIPDFAVEYLKSIDD